MGSGLPSELLMLYQDSVLQMQYTVAPFQHAFIVGNHDCCFAFAFDLFCYHPYDLLAALEIQARGRLVREQNRRLVHPGSGNRHTLFLSP
ncbi:hypothetical protein D3C71_2009460 [compost metagenome]